MISRITRLLVLERANYRCERCGRTVIAALYSLQHRRARGMGGSRRKDTDTAVNAGVLCGSATSPDGCHYAVEANPMMARDEGWRVAQHEDPAAIPVRLYTGQLVYFTSDGGYMDVL